MELKIKCVNTTTSSDGSQYGKFVIEPLEKGFGTTIGNSLRRVLLSSLEGTAVTAARIEGITHEYTAIPGVLEDVIDVMLNLKGLVVKTDSKEPQQLRIDVDRPGAVLASDIQLPAGVKVVSYNVESTRVGDSIDFDKLTLEIWSNGSIDVTNALSQAANLLIDHFMQIAAITGQPVITPSMAIEEEKDEDANTPTMTIEELELSVRAYNCLKRASINSMAELLKKSEHDLLNIKNFGKKSSDEVIERLHHFGLDLAPNPEVEEEV